MKEKSELQTRIIADLERFKKENQESIHLSSKKHSEWIKDQEKEFKDVYKRVKSYIKSKGLIIPKNDFEELFYKYYRHFEKNKEVLRATQKERSIWEIEPMTESDIVIMAQKLTKEVQSKTTKSHSKDKEDPINDLEKLYTDSGRSQEYENLKEILFDCDCITSDYSTWKKPAISLSGLIKFIGRRDFQKTFSSTEVIAIAKKNFNCTFRVDTAKKGSIESGAMFFSDF